MSINFDLIPKDFLLKIEKIKICENFAPIAKLVENGEVFEVKFQKEDVYVEKRSLFPLRYAIIYHGNCMSKSGQFSCERIPSSRTDEYLAEHRFKSIQEAVECFKKNFPNQEEPL